MKNFTFRMKKPTRKGFFVIIIIISILLVVIAGFSMNIYTSKTEVTAIISVTDEVYRIDEPIQFIGEESKGDIIQYQWDFGDGSTSEEQNPTHTFNETDWYNVTLVVQGKNEMKSETTAVIAIQPPDDDLSDSRGPGTAWRLSRALTTRLDVLLFSIGEPVIELQLNVLNPVGSISINADIYWEFPDTGMESISLYSEEYTATGNNVDIHLIIEPDDIPDEIGDTWSVIEFVYVLDEGMDGGVDMTVTAVYPIDNLMPPWENE